MPYKPLYHHQYWFIDVRYLVKLEGQWVYSICIIEGVSRTILAGMASRHWAHRDRTDDRLTPVAVLDGRLGRVVAPDQLRRVFRHLQFSRVVNRHGNVSIQPFYIYAERGLSKRRVTLWFYEDRLHVEYKRTLLARYHYRLKRGSTQIGSISNPKLYRTQFISPQLEPLELDDEQWTKSLNAHRTPDVVAPSPLLFDSLR